MEIALDNFEARKRRPVNLDAYSLLRQAFDAAIGYEHSLGPKSGDTTTARGLVQNYIHERFHDDFYVNREDDENMICETFGKGGVLAITGERGSGKSTILNRVCEETARLTHSPAVNLQPTILERESSDIATHEVVFLDLKTDGSAIDREDVTTEEILVFLLRVLVDSVVNNKGSVAFATSWDLFRIRQSPSHFEYRSQVKVILHGDDAEQLIAGRQDPVLHSVWSECEKEFHSAERIQESLSLFFSFLATDHSHNIALVVDSLDHLDPDAQTSAAIALGKLVSAAKGGSSAIMAIRQENYPAVERALERYGVIDELSLEARPLNDASIDLVREFLRSRLMAVYSLREELVAVKPGTAMQPDFDELVEDTFALIVVFVSQALSPQRQNALIDHLRQWHNGSLRKIGETVQRMLLDALSDGHELSPYSALREATQPPEGLELEEMFKWAEVAEVPEELLPAAQEWEEQNRTLVRTHLFRKFYFCGDKRRQGSQSQRVPDSLPLRRLADRPKQSRLTFPKMRAIDLLLQQENHEMAVGEMLGRLKSFGLGDIATKRALRQLSERRYAGDTGLIWIDVDGRLFPKDFDESSTTRVHLQPAGAYLRERWSFSSEYLFWCASLNPQARSIFTAVAGEFGELVAEKSPIPFSLVSDYGYRTRVSARYLKNFVVDRYKLELPLPSADGYDHDDCVSHIQKVFETFGEAQFPNSAATSIRSYANDLHASGLMAADQLEKMLEDTNAAQRYCDAVRSLVAL